MKSATFEHDIFIRTDVARVLNLISDYNQQQIFHPLIVQVEQVASIPENSIEANIARRTGNQFYTS